MQKEIPFSNINDTECIHLTKDLKVKPKKRRKETIFEKLNLFSDNENITCKYYTTEQFKENGFDKHNNKMTLLHLNISSLPYHIDEFTELLSDLKINFKIIGITESRLTAKKDPINNINIPGYNIEHTPTKSDKGGALLYISTELNYKSRNDLKLYKDKNRESVFIEVLSKSDKNTVIGCIYKHSNLAIQEFMDTFLQPLLDKLSYENKNVILLGDFNIDLLHYESHIQTREFLDKIYFGSLSPHITIPTRITPRSRTLIDNIFTNTMDEPSISGNLMCSISDHLAQFLIHPEQNAKKCLNEKTKYKRNYKKVNKEKFEQDLQHITWVEALKVNDTNVDTSLGNFLQIINSVLEKHILTSIRNKNKIHNKFCKAKDQDRKDLLYQQFKNYRNILSNFTKKSKENYYKEYFLENKNNLIKVWQGIKDIILIKKHNRVQPTFLKINDRLTTNNKKIAEEFNIFFGTIAQKIDQKIPKSKKHFILPSATTSN